MRLRIAIERDRRCDGCEWLGVVYFIALGGKTFRACGPCFAAAERLRVRLHTENLDAAETFR